MWFSGALPFLSGSVTSGEVEKQAARRESSVNVLLNFSSHRGDCNQQDKAAADIATSSEY